MAIATTWLDRVLATPTIGCLFEPVFKSEHETFACLRPLMEKWATRGDLKIESGQPLHFAIQTTNGFRYSLSHERLSVEFKYPSEIRAEPGKIPTLAYSLEIDKYSSLLQKVADECSEFMVHILGKEKRSITRIGVVVSARLDPEALPPGINTFLDYLQRPWGRPCLKLQPYALAVLEEQNEFRDQCHHKFDLDLTDENRKNEVRIALDWQRVQLKPIDLRADKLKGFFEKYSNLALEYFERFATGDLEYGKDD